MLSGKRILLTGANGGIGLAICKTFLENKANLILFYHQKRNELDSLLAQYNITNSSVELYNVDLLDLLKLKQVLQQVIDKGHVDGFVHSVTFSTTRKNFADMQWEDIQAHIELQTKSFFQIVQSLLPSMKERKKGRIVSILTSYVVGSPPNSMSNYIVGKYSLLGLTKSLSVELGSYGITVNSVSPSMTNTPLLNPLPNKLKEIVKNQTPLQKLAEPKDVASAALFLCSDYADYISGENLLVTGGSVMY